MTQPETLKIDEVLYIRADAAPKPDKDLDGKPYVIVRSRNQGVMSGYLHSYSGQTVTLLRARQLWYWKSKFVLADLAETGPKDGCKFSAEMSQPMVMLEACAIFHCTAAAGESIRSVVAQEK